jgi:hypothetical protein
MFEYTLFETQINNWKYLINSTIQIPTITNEVIHIYHLKESNTKQLIQVQKLVDSVCGIKTNDTACQNTHHKQHYIHINDNTYNELIKPIHSFTFFTHSQLVYNLELQLPDITCKMSTSNRTMQMKLQSCHATLLLTYIKHQSLIWYYTVLMGSYFQAH